MFTTGTAFAKHKQPTFLHVNVADSDTKSNCQRSYYKQNPASTECSEMNLTLTLKISVQGRELGLLTRLQTQIRTIVCYGGNKRSTLPRPKQQTCSVI